MADHAQLRLLSLEGDQTDPYYEAVWKRMLAGLEDAVAALGVKHAAAELDTSPSVLKHALAGRDRHYVRAQWLPYLIDRAPNDDIVRVLADIRGLDILPRKPLSPEEELARIKQVLGEALGPELREAIWRRVYRQ